MTFFLYLLGAAPLAAAIYLTTKSVREDILTLEELRESDYDRVSDLKAHIKKVESRITNLEQDLEELNKKRKGGRPKKVKE